jgi:hypothetical protein
MPVYTNPTGGQQQLVDQPPSQPQQQAEQGFPAAAAPAVQALPATGIQQQVAGVNQQRQAMPATLQGEQPGQLPGAQQMGQTSLTGLASKLASSYGLPVGRQGLVDPQGNFLQTPEQISAMSGGQVSTVDAAAKMNYIAAAITRQQQRASQQKARGALEAGAKLVQSRGRGSLAAMQSGFYQQLSQLYASEQHEAADFSYFIQQDRFNRALREMRKQRKAAKKSRRIGMVGSLAGMALGGAFGGMAGAAIGGQLGGQLGGAV